MASIAVARHDLLPGTALTADDVSTALRPSESLPADVVSTTSAVLGQVVAFPVRAGEPLVSRHVLGSQLLEALGPDIVATAVRLADDSATSVLRAGDVVDVIAAASGDVGAPGRASVVASRVRVLVAGTRAAGDGGLFGSAGSSSNASGLLVLATTTAQAVDIARAGVGARLSVTVRGS